MVETVGAGNVRKMKVSLDQPVQYRMPLGDTEVPLNPLLGEYVQLEYNGVINCIHCSRKTKKSFNQGYCYPCFKGLARCDTCIVSPEKCHFDAGTCREPEWGEQNCMIEHVVYLSNTSGVKIGITRGGQVPIRWIDQGAVRAKPIFKVDTRYRSGLLESLFKAHIADKTHWQAMLKGPPEPRDLEEVRQQLLSRCHDGIQILREEYGLQAVSVLEDAPETEIVYPVLEYPTKVKSFNLDKTSTVGGKLMGIKGQYLIFDCGVINIRKYAGYHLTLTVH